MTDYPKDRVTSVFRGVDRAHCEEQARTEAGRAASDGYRVIDQHWSVDGTTPVLTVRYGRSSGGIGVGRSDPSPWTTPRVLGLIIFILVFVAWVLISARPT